MATPIDPRERFTATADLYEKHRPDYPEALFRWLEETTGVGSGARVVDLGCGTGIASRQMAARGWRVAGVDPNREMLRRALRAGAGPGGGAGGEVEYLRAAAEAVPLAAACAHLVTAANSFHWFDTARALAEIARIGRWGAAFWNTRADSPFNDEYEALLRRYSPEYVALFSSNSPVERLAAAVDLCRAELSHQQTLDRDSFFGRVYSASYVVHGVSDRAGFDRALDDLFGRHAPDGKLLLRYRTEAFAWRA